MHRPAVIFMDTLPGNWPATFPGCAALAMARPEAPPDMSPTPPPVVVVPEDERGVHAVTRFLLGESPSAHPGGGSDAEATLSRLRHAVNNALTSALAETQFALMGEVDDETRSSLAVVEAQLKVIRDTVAASRPPSPRRPALEAV